MLSRVCTKLLKPTIIPNVRLISSTRILKDKEYLPNEEWIARENNIIKLGVTKNAIEQLGELVYIDFNFENNDIVKKDEEIINIESVKSVESICAPFDCKIIDNNISILEDLDVINDNPECENKSWIIKIEEV
jgi:glycine cleavage system H protein